MAWCMDCLMEGGLARLLTESMIGWMAEFLGWSKTDRRIIKKMFGRITCWIDNGRLDDAQLDGWMAGWNNAWLNSLITDWMDNWLGQWMAGWIVGRFEPCEPGDYLTHRFEDILYRWPYCVLRRCRIFESAQETPVAGMVVYACKHDCDRVHFRLSLDPD